MFKNISFFLKNTFYRITRKVLKNPIGYKDALTIGVLINNPDSNFNYAINDFIQELINEDKKVEVICFIDKELNRLYDFKYISLSRNDINWKGDFKGEKVNKFIKTEFDYLYSINILPFLPFENIILKSRSKFRIGYYFNNQRKIFDFMISLRDGEKLDSLVKNMMIYTKKIKQ
jgi:hypothetical protein